MILAEAASSGGAQRRLELLVVDDDDVDRERVRRLLARSAPSIVVSEAASGAEALAHVRSHAFDCVVLDNDLGDTSGAELLTELRNQACTGFPVVFVTGAGNEALAVQVLHCGASDYLVKTQLDAEALARSVRRSVEHYRLSRENEELHLRLARQVEAQAAAIRQGERDLRALIDHSPVVMGCWDRGLRCRFGNQAHADWFGHDVERLPGSHLDQVLEPGLRAACEAAIVQVLRGHTRSFEHRLPTRHAQVLLSPDHGDDGEVAGFYLMLTDVTAIKAAQDQAEELMGFNHAVVEHSPIGIAVFDAAGAGVRANAAFVALSGLSPQALREADLRGRPAWRRAGLDAAFEATLADGLPRRLELRFEAAPDMSERHGPAQPGVHWDCALARVDRGGAPHLLLIARDTSDQHRAHEALVRARDVAESAARAKSAFLANMSHEIRTPMNAIVGLSRLALDDALPPRARDFVAKVHGSAVALMGLLDDVLDYSKIDAGHLRLERIAFDLDELMQRVLDLFQARAAQRGLALRVELPPDLARWRWGDPLRLSQVLNNLVGNALKFTARGSVVLGVADAAGRGDAALHFEVRDTGIGIPLAQQAQLFEAFVQADDSVTRRYGGSGLGLAICKRLVALMGGEIGLRSQPGQGTQVWFRVPLAPAPAPQGVSADDAAVHEPAWQAVAGRVLVVEDNPLNQLVCVEMLRGLGLDSEVVADGLSAVEAVAAAPSGHYRLVLMDLHMPGLDGLEATRRIRAHVPAGRLPIVGLTAAAMQDDRQHCLDAGMQDHLAKPVLPEQLRGVLRRWLPAAPPPVVAIAAVPPAPPLLDLGAAAASLRLGPAVMLRMLEVFVLHESGRVALLSQHHAQDDWQAVHHIAHELKGAAASLGAQALAAAAAELQDRLERCFGRGGPPSAATAPVLTPSVRAGLDAALAEVQQLLAQTLERAALQLGRKPSTDR